VTLLLVYFLHVNLFVSLYSTGQLSAVEYLTVCNCNWPRPFGSFGSSLSSQG